MLNTLKILNVKITNELEEKVLEYLFERLKKGKQKTFIITPNPEMLVYAKNDLAYQDKLNSANIAIPDGVGLFFAGGLLGTPLKERITGVDFLERVCKEVREKPLFMGFLGGRGVVAKTAAECLKKRYPWIKIAFAGSEWSEYEAMKKKSKEPLPTIDILFVAFGVPKQEEWIFEHLSSIPVKAAMGVGGAFDFLSGTVLRAPFIVRFFGLEWLFRLTLQPWRWKRQIALLEFISLVIKQKFSNS